MAGCGSSLSSRDRAACSTFTGELPSRVADQRLSDHDDTTASWGDPAIELTCGVGKPKDLTPTSRCERANGVDWFVPEDEIGQKPVDVTMTTVGRSPRIEVRVPKEYWPPTAVMVDLAPLVRTKLTKTRGCS